MRKPILLSDLSTYRSQLMGLAMIFVMLFHVGMPRSNPFFGFNRCGNVGVDMFLFLSGIGLWYSWTRNSDLKHFFVHRYKRIYPAWLIMACAFYIPNYLQTDGGGYSPDALNLVLNIAVNWRVDDLSFWFIPSIMLMYTFAPAYMRLISRHPAYQWLAAVFMVVAVMVQYFPPVHQAVGHLEIFFSRIPVFLIGINFGQVVKRQEQLSGATIWLLLIAFVLSLSMCVEFEREWRGHFPLFLERMVYIPLTLSSLILFTQLLHRTPLCINKMLAFIGGISLELYLIHIHFVLRYLTPYKLGYAATATLMVAVSIPLAWLLHTLIDKTLFKKKQKRT